MNVNSKHMATFLLGAAAAYGVYKYAKLSDEEKEKLMNNLKDKANSLKTHAEDSVEKAKDYFAELKTKGGDALKEHFPGMEEFFGRFFKHEAPEAATETTTAPVTT